MYARFLTILLGSALLLLGCPDGDDDDDVADDDAADDDTGDDDTGDDDVADDDTGDDDTGPAAGIEATYPEDGSTDFYHRESIVVEFDDPISGGDLTLVEDSSGDGVTGTVSMDGDDVMVFDPFGDSADDHLTPSTAYTATIQWDGSSGAELHFSTSDVGLPIADPQTSVAGYDYLLDLSGATFTEPPGVGALLGGYLADIHQILHLADVDDGAGTVAGYGAAVTFADPDYSQDLCIETVDLDGTWSNPYFQIGPADLHLPVEGASLTIYDTTLTASLSPDGTILAGGTFDGTMDTRGVDCVVDPSCAEGATCTLLSSIMIDCEPCPDGSGDFCLRLSAYGAPGGQVTVTGADPETGANYGTLTQVTAQMVSVWTAGGYCP